MWIEETRNGKYKAVERYTDYLTGKTKRVSVTMEKNTAQARKVAQITLQEKIQQTYKQNKPEDITLKKLVDEYRRGQKNFVKASTYNRNYYVCNTILSILGERTIVSRMSAKYIRDKLIASGKDSGSLNELLIRIKALIRWGYHNDLIDNISFLDRIEPFKDVSKREKIQDKYLESSELKSLLQVMTIDLWRGITHFLALTGLRIGELIALENQDIDLEERVIHITKTWDTNNQTTTTTKTLTSTRDVFIQDELLPVIKKLRRMMLEQKIMYGYEATPLFLSDTKGCHIKYDAYRKYLREKSIKAIGRAITPHTLRHTHASLLLENGVPIDSISRRLGHEDSRITKEIYLHITEKLREKDNVAIKDIKII